MASSSELKKAVSWCGTRYRRSRDGASNRGQRAGVVRSGGLTQPACAVMCLWGRSEQLDTAGESRKGGAQGELWCTGHGDASSSALEAHWSGHGWLGHGKLVAALAPACNDKW
ncbi:hypothetical protein E2562_026223 [Oryza meyeriana var. granulata]|uniref:Uncharacterized protein n=1 Tax=Oryza meyeriana var. granulata TaxID=110450 RepID=A0A6G1CIL3_9ORYZ|nr:hypothetical protein E2562_026223 [Oryza meyeriana var. granulata]